jgi:outer membrane cobalamin receptor
MLKSRKIFFVQLSVLLIIQSILTAHGQISGRIIDKATGQPIPDANITVLDSQRGTISKDGGFYFLDNLPDGRHHIQANVIGYGLIVKDISIPGDQIVDFELESKPIEYDPVVVTATLSEHLRSNVTVSADILTKTRMTELNGNTAGEIIESVSGVYANSYDGFAGLNTPSIRGAEASQVLVLMDGVRLNTAQGGGVDLNTIPLAAIERVEVIKGGHSALLGSDAVGGAIHLISNDMVTMKGFHYGANTTIGSFGTQMVTINGSHRVGTVTLFASYNRIQSDGDFEYKAPSGKLEERVNNDYRSDNLFLKSKVKLNPFNTLQIVYHRMETEQGIAGNVNISSYTGLPQTTPKARSDSERNTFKIESVHQITNRLLFKEQIGYHTYAYHYTNPEDWIPTDDLHENKSLSANVQGIVTMNRNVSVTAGLNYQRDDLSSTKFTHVDSRTMKSVFGQIELKHNLAMTRWTWIPAVRHDGYSDVGSCTSPKLGVVVTTGENANCALKGNIGTSYRVPTLNDLYWPADAYTEGNPNLVPETGTHFDFGLQFSDYTKVLFQVEATYFNSTIQDMIAWQSGADYIWRPTNVGRAKISGIESGLKFRLPSEIVTIHVCYTKMKATDETENSENKGNRLIYRPDDKWDILLGSKWGPVHANINYRIVSKSYTASDNLESLDGYQVLNANIGAEIVISGFAFHVRLQGLNLTDKNIFLNDGYPLPGREFRFTVGVNY